MASTVEICNIGLSYVGLGAINSLTEESPEARACNLHYENQRLILLEAFPWSFATGRQVLALLTNDREDEWTYRYQRPSGVLTLRWVQDTAIIRALRESHQKASSPYALSESSIYTDVETASAEWTNDETDPNEFPPTFRDALSWAIAKSVAVSITEVASRLEYATQQYVMAREKAEMMELAERDNESVVVADWLRERGYTTQTFLNERYGAGPY